MRILSISDIHGDVYGIECLVDKLKKDSRFDLIVVAGDIASSKEDSKEIITLLSTIQPKIFYVQGNWDDYPYETQLSKKSCHLHLNHKKINGWCFLGYSGSEANGYRRNPSLDGSFEHYNKNKKKYKKIFKTYYEYRRSVIFDELYQYLDVNDIDVDELVLVTHDRLYKLPFTPFMYIFGHQHNPKYTYHRGIHLLNTSYIPKRITLRDDDRYNYCIINLNQEAKVVFNDMYKPVCYMNKNGEIKIKHITNKDYRDRSGRY
jgi:predicted phosphodiesterase